MHTITINNHNILLLSDTHGKHRLTDIPENIQIVIHCGDVCTDGNMSEIADFFLWYSELKIAHKIFIHGNHDLPFELEPEWSKRLIPKGVCWLNDNSIIINKIKIAGISGFPYFYNTEHATKADIIISHYPPYGILDNGYGLKEIKKFVSAYKPRYHIFGHNHAENKKEIHKNICYMNASIYNELCQKENH